MQNKQHKLSEGVKQSCKERIEREVRKIYPDEKIDSKYLLVVNADLYFPYRNECMGNLTLVTENGEIAAPKTKINTPYWNKGIRKISAVKGRGTCYIGVPFLFENYDELAKVKQIRIDWDIPGEISFAMKIEYNISFRKVDGLNKYFVYSKDMPIESVVRLDEPLEEKDENSLKMLLDYLREFDDLLVRYTSKDGEEATAVIKNSEYGLVFPSVTDIHSADVRKSLYQFSAVVELEPQETCYFPDTKNG